MKCLNFLLTLAISILGMNYGIAQSQIMLKHSGAYMGKFKVTYNLYGTPVPWNSGDKAAGYNYTVTIPAGATNIKIKAEVMTFPWPAETWKDICNITAGRSGGTLSIGGTSLHTSHDWKPDDGVSGAAGTVTVNQVTMDAVLAGGNTQLHNAIRAKNNIQAQQLIDNGTTHINTKNNRGFSPLHEAVQANSPAGIDMLLDAGANMYVEDNMRQTPLFLAVKTNKKELVSKFAEKGYNMAGATKAAEQAVKSRNTEMVKLFLDNGFDAGVICSKAVAANNMDLAKVALDQYGAQPTIELYKKAVDTRKFDFAEELITRNIDANQALDYAIQKNATKLVNTAMENGGDAQKALQYAVEKRDVVMATNAITINSADPNQVLDYSVKNRQNDMVTMLLTSGANADQALTYAVNYKNDQMIDIALGGGASVKDSHVKSVASQGNNKTLETLIKAGGSADAGLKAAMDAGKYQTADMLIQAGAKPDGVVKIAVEKKQKNLLMTALDYQADPNPGLAPAIKSNMTDYAKILFTSGATTNDAGLIKTTVDNNNLALCELMIDNGTEADLAMSPAVAASKEAFVKMLIGKGADATKPALIKTACEKKNTAIIGLLVQNGADANQGMPIAISSNDTDLTKLLLENGADGTQPDFIKTAAGNANLTITDMLLKAGADANNGMMPAIKANSTEVVKSLLANGADGSSSELIIASVGHNNTGLTEQLIAAGADPTACLTPSLSKGADKVLNLIAEQGVDVSVPAYLHKAASSNQSNIASVLIHHGNDPLHVDASNNTYLHVAAPTASSQMINVLTAAGIDVNEQNSAQNTALHIVVKRGKAALDVVNALIAAGANVNITNGTGIRPLDVAKNGKVKRTLKKAGATKSKKSR